MAFARHLFEQLLVQLWVVPMHDAAHPIAIYDPGGVTLHLDPLPRSSRRYSKFDRDRTCAFKGRNVFFRADTVRAL